LLTELPGIETDSLAGLLPSELPVRSVSVPFVACGSFSIRDGVTTRKSIGSDRPTGSPYRRGVNKPTLFGRNVNQALATNFNKNGSLPRDE
jgi:hypothetical protein